MAEWLKINGFSYAWLLQIAVIAVAGAYAYGFLNAEVTNLKESTKFYARKDVIDPRFKNVDDKFLSLNTSLDDKFININNNLKNVEVRMAGINQNLSKILILLAEK